MALSYQTDSDPELYSSTKDITPETAKAAPFENDPEIGSVIGEPVKVQLPATTVFSTKTVIPTKTQIVPDLAAVPPVPTVQINVEKLAKTFDEPTAMQIVSDIKENVPLPEKVAEILVSKNIVSQPNPADVAPAKQVIIAEGNPVVDKPAEGSPKPLRKRSILDSFTNYIYKLLYK